MDQRHPPSATAAFYVVGLAVCVLATGVFLAALAVLSFGISSCELPTSAAEVRRARAGLGLAAIVWASAPGGCWLWAHHTRRGVTLWAVLTVVVGLVGSFLALTLAPSTRCF